MPNKILSENELEVGCLTVKSVKKGIQTDLEGFSRHSFAQKKWLLFIACKRGSLLARPARAPPPFFACLPRCPSSPTLDPTPCLHPHPTARRINSDRPPGVPPPPHRPGCRDPPSSSPRATSPSLPTPISAHPPHTLIHRHLPPHRRLPSPPPTPTDAPRRPPSLPPARLS